MCKHEYKETKSICLQAWSNTEDIYIFVTRCEKCGKLKTKHSLTQPIEWIRTVMVFIIVLIIVFMFVTEYGN